MGFSRYAIEKKQVSTDRGVTWSDCTPSETQRGNLIGTYRTLLECEDAACELEEYRYSVIEGALPNEFCGDMISVLPSGIAKTIQFTAGAICCSEWQTASPYAYDFIKNENVSLALGKINCIHDFNTTYCPSFTYSANTVVGMEVHNHCFDVRQHKDWICPETLCSCFQITEFMPWCENKTSWKLIKKQRYYREHCSDEWIEDGEPVVIGIAERWKFVSDDFYKETWQHQQAKTFDENGNVIEWVNIGSPNITYYDSTLPSGLEIIDEIRSDGTMLTADSNLMSQIGIMQFRRGDYSSIEGVALSVGSESKYKLYSSSIEGTTFKYYDRPGDVSLFNCIFFNPIIDKWHCNTDVQSGKWIWCDYISGVSDVLNGICSGLIRVNGVNSIQQKLETLFPYRIPAPTFDMEDDYYNSSEFGYVRRDGTVYPLGYVNGKYKDSDGNIRHISTSAEIEGTWGNFWHYSTPIPSNVTDVWSTMSDIPSRYLSSRTSLSSVTLTDAVSIGERSFSGTTALNSITFPSSLREIKTEAFSNGGLSAVSFNNVETVGLGAFQDCQQLVDIDFGSVLSGISEDCFTRNSGLANVVIPSNVKSIGSRAFRVCTSLSSLTISEGVTLIGNQAFYGCTSLRSVTIPSSVDSYGAAFWDCSSLEYVTINTTANINEYTFYGCNIKELTLTVTTPPVCDNGRYTWSRFFTFAQDAVILVPASAVDAYKNDTHQGGWKNVANMIYPIPNETVWVNIGYACVDGQRYDYKCKMGRNTEYSNDWFFLPEYRTVGEPYGECDGTEPY